jgi:hypothetical protein
MSSNIQDSIAENFPAITSFCGAWDLWVGLSFSGQSRPPLEVRCLERDEIRRVG